MANQYETWCIALKAAQDNYDKLTAAWQVADKASAKAAQDVEAARLLMVDIIATIAKGAGAYVPPVTK